MAKERPLLGRGLALEVGNLVLSPHPAHLYLQGQLDIVYWPNRWDIQILLI